jgi:3'-5' exoribonuclease
LAKHTLITDLSASQLVEGVYAVQNCQLGLTKGGKPYLKCLLADKSGRTPGRMWNASEELYKQLPTDGFVFIEGQTQPYQGELQIIINAIKAVDPTESDLRDLIPSTDKDVDQMFADLRAMLGTFEDPSVAALARAYLDDDELMNRFRAAPAAQTLHHAYLGGLLEHTLSVLRLAEVFCPLYPQLNRDIILMGVFLHDLGKCVELTWERGFGYSDDGQLVGHVARGVLWLEAKAQACADAGQPIATPVLQVLHHIILSHHGRPEFGALKMPSTPEAIAVNLLDNLDAKLYMALTATRGDQTKPGELGGNFTEKIWALETRLYRPDPTTVEEPGSDE